MSRISSYEVVTGPHGAGRFFSEDRRDVTPDAVSHVMELFARHYMGKSGGADQSPASLPLAKPADLNLLAEDAVQIICDEEKIDAGSWPLRRGSK